MNYLPLEIIDDDNSELIEKSIKNKKVKKIPNILEKYYSTDKIEIGLDEVGRGPLFGRVYTAAVILPKDDSFDHSKMKDSKKFSSKKKLIETAEYIKENCIAWSINYEDEKVIDNINILQATQQAMHKSINNIIDKINITHSKINDNKDYLLLIDGNYFKPLINENIKYTHKCIEGGDNKYTSIAAASILAKVERDNYIKELCDENIELIEKYSIDSNKGYGSKKHLDGIKQYGITQWHRKSFGICKQFK